MKINISQLDDAEKNHLLTSHEKRVIIESMEYVATNLTSKYTLVGKEVNEIMVGPGEALEFKATQILNEGIAIGRVEGHQEGLEEGEIIGTIKAYAKMKSSPSQIVKSIMDDYGLKQKEAEKYVEETLNIVKA